MPPMSLLRLEPNQTLTFSKSSPNQTLKLKNVSSGNVAFKVKTTAPSAYLVRPSYGVLEPDNEKDVQIILQPAGQDATISSHRFLIQAVQRQSADEVTRDEWTEIAKNKDTMQEARLNVALEEAPAGVPSKVTKDAAPTGSPAAENPSPENLKEKYDELVQYTLQLEKEKKKIEDQKRELTISKNEEARSAGYNMFHIVLVALIAFLCSYAAKFASGSSTSATPSREL